VTVTQSVRNQSIFLTFIQCRTPPFY